MTTDREQGRACLTNLGLSTSEAEAFFDQFRRPRCSVCDGDGEDPTGPEIDPACCSHCGGSGREPGERP